MDFDTMRLPVDRDVLAPDGSDVRILLRLERGSMAHFQLNPVQISVAMEHRNVEEVWYVVGGRGEMWRRQGDREEIVAMEPGTCLSIPAGTSFQFRCLGDDPLTAVAVTMPPWPGDGEARPVEGRWPEPGSTVRAG